MTELERQNRRWQEARDRLYGRSTRQPEPPTPPPAPCIAPLRVPELPPATYEDLQKLVSELAGQAKPTMLLRAAASAIGTRREALTARDRSRPTVRIRATLVWLMVRVCTNHSNSQCARVLGRDHSSFLNLKSQWPDEPPELSLAHAILAATRRLIYEQRELGRAP